MIHPPYLLALADQTQCCDCTIPKARTSSQRIRWSSWPMVPRDTKMFKRLWWDELGHSSSCRRGSREHESAHDFLHFCGSSFLLRYLIPHVAKFNSSWHRQFTQRSCLLRFREVLTCWSMDSRHVDSDGTSRGVWRRSYIRLLRRRGYQSSGLRFRKSFTICSTHPWILTMLLAYGPRTRRCLVYSK